MHAIDNDLNQSTLILQTVKKYKKNLKWQEMSIFIRVEQIQNISRLFVSNEHFWRVHFRSIKKTLSVVLSYVIETVTLILAFNDLIFQGYKAGLL